MLVLTFRLVLMLVPRGTLLLGLALISSAALAQGPKLPADNAVAQLNGYIEYIDGRVKEMDSLYEGDALRKHIESDRGDPDSPDRHTIRWAWESARSRLFSDHRQALVDSIAVIKIQGGIYRDQLDYLVKGIGVVKATDAKCRDTIAGFYQFMVMKMRSHEYLGDAGDNRIFSETRDQCEIRAFTSITVIKDDTVPCEVGTVRNCQVKWETLHIAYISSNTQTVTENPLYKNLDLVANVLRDHINQPLATMGPAWLVTELAATSPWDIIKSPTTWAEGVVSRIKSGKLLLTNASWVPTPMAGALAANAQTLAMTIVDVELLQATLKSLPNKAFGVATYVDTEFDRCVSHWPFNPTFEHQIRERVRFTPPSDAEEAMSHVTFNPTYIDPILRLPLLTKEAEQLQHALQEPATLQDLKMTPADAENSLKAVNGKIAALKAASSEFQSKYQGQICNNAAARQK